MIKWYKKALAAFLTIAMVFTSFPLITSVQAESQTAPITEAANEEPQQSYILDEITDKRESNKKVFLMSDQTYWEAVYPQNVHFLQDGKWQDVDNRMTPSTDENNEAVWATKKNSFKTKFAKKAKNKKLVSLTQGQYRIDWSLLGAQKVTAQVVSASDKKNENAAALKNVNGTVQYADILTGTDLRYTVTADAVKEDIILKDSTAPARYTFAYAFKKLSYRITEKKRIELYDAAAAENTLFVIDTPFMYDANGERSDKVDVQITETKKGIQIELAPDPAWLAAETRAWPVTIDPMVSYPQDALAVTDTYIHSGDGAQHSDSYYLLVAKGTGGESEAYIRFDTLLPMAYNVRILQARLNLLTVEVPMLASYTYSNPTPLVMVQQVGSYWSDTMLWSGRPSPSLCGPEIDYALVNNGNAWFSWDITSIVNNWYNGASNNGIVLRMHESVRTAGRGVTFYAPEYMSNAYQNGQSVSPYLEFNYSVSNGLESYWPYHTATVNNAGTAYVNDFNGNLVYQTPALAEVPGNRMPFALSLIYNSAYSHIVPGSINLPELYGRGFRLSMQQYLSNYSDTNIPFSLLDGDGTLHYFYKDTAKNEIRDQDGLGLKLTDHANYTANARWDITDKDGNVCVFDSGGYIRSISDPNGNTVTYTYETWAGTNKRITAITGPAQHTITLTYDSTADRLTKITDPAGRITTFTYNSNNALTCIHTPDGDIGLEYYAIGAVENYGLLRYIYEKSTDTYGRYSVNFTYDTYSASSVYRTPRVNTLTEKSETTAYSGNWLHFSYQGYQTLITDQNGQTKTLQFNAAGNPTYQIDAQGNVQAQVFTNRTGFANNRVSTATTQKSVTNLLTNPSFSRGLAGWFYDSANSATAQASIDSNNGSLTKGCIKVTKTANHHTYALFGQDINNLPAGYYTLSGYVNTFGQTVTGKGARLYLQIWRNSDNACISSALSEPIYKTDTWEWHQATIYLPEGCRIRAMGGYPYADGAGTAWFDDLQLETGVTASPYNLVENGAFLNGLTAWAYAGATGTVDITDNKPYGFTKANTINSTVNARFTRYAQTIKTAGKKGDVFSICGWAKAVASTKKIFALTLEFYDLNGVYVTDLSSSFNPYVQDWQFTSSKIIAPCDYSEVHVYYSYNGNINTMTATGMCLQKEQYGQTYTYDDNGNVVSSADFAKSQSAFSYKNNQLTQMLNPSGSKYFYSYAYNEADLAEAISTDGQRYSFTYDTAGNPLSATVEKDKPVTNPQTGVAYTIRNAKTGNVLDRGYVGKCAYNWRYRKGNTYQQWKLEATNETGVYYLKCCFAYENEKYLYVKNSANTDNADLTVSVTPNTEAHKFKLHANGDGTFCILTKASNYTKCLDSLPGASVDTGDSSALKQYTRTADDKAQHWLFHPDITGSNPVDPAAKKIVTTAAYTADKNYMSSVTDARGNTTSYAYNATKGLLNSTTDPNGNLTQYAYNANNDQLQSVTAGGSTVSYAYNKDRLTGINVSNGVQYTLQYDAFGRTSATKVGNTTLSSVEYNANGLMSRQDYGNGDYKRTGDGSMS